MTTTVVNNSVFGDFFEKEKLTGPNFIDWYHNLQIVLSVAPRQEIPLDVLVAHTTWVKACNEIAGLMFMTMVPEIQKNLEQLGAYDMLKKLKTLFSQQVKHELLQTVRDFHACKHEEGQSVSSYVLNMKSYMDNLERLGKGKTKLAYAPSYAPKPKIIPPLKQDNPAKDAI
ncbi:hypothetical protein Tco_0099322 [Tanacetum coccineum]